MRSHRSPGIVSGECFRLVFTRRMFVAVASVAVTVHFQYFSRDFTCDVDRN